MPQVRKEDKQNTILDSLPPLPGKSKPILRDNIIVLPADSVRPYLPDKVTVSELDRMARDFIVGKKTLSNSRDVRQQLEERVVKRIGKKGKYLTDKLFELIEGVHLVDNINGKTVRYYKTPPNLNAIIYALNRVLGSPKQTVDKSEEKRGIYVVEHIIKTLATPVQATPEMINSNGNRSGTGGV